MNEQLAPPEEVALQAEREKINDAQRIVWANLQQIEKDYPKGSLKDKDWDGVEFKGHMGDDNGTLYVMADRTNKNKRLSPEKFTGTSLPVDLSGREVYYDNPKDKVRLITTLSERAWEGVDQQTRLAVVQDAIRQSQAFEESNPDLEKVRLRLEALAAIRQSLAEETAQIETNYGSVGLKVSAGEKGKE